MPHVLKAQCIHKNQRQSVKHLINKKDVIPNPSEHCYHVLATFWPFNIGFKICSCIQETFETQLPYQATEAVLRLGRILYVQQGSWLLPGDGQCSGSHAHVPSRGRRCVLGSDFFVTGRTLQNERLLYTSTPQALQMPRSSHGSSEKVYSLGTQALKEAPIRTHFVRH